MKNYKVLLCVCCLFFANQSFAKTILPSNKTKFVSLFNSKVGDYELVSGDARYCDSGSLMWLDKNNTDLGFRLGSLISFIDLHNGTQTNKVPDFCLVTTKFKYSNIGLTMDLRQDRCDNNSDILDVSRTLNFVSDTQLEYLIKNANVQCKFELKRL